MKATDGKSRCDDLTRVSALPSRPATSGSPTYRATQVSLGSLPFPRHPRVGLPVADISAAHLTSRRCKGNGHRSRARMSPPPGEGEAWVRSWGLVRQ